MAKPVISPAQANLKPHTSAWFEALMLLDSGKALHTMALIAAANGDEDICGMCGDKPAFDYSIIIPRSWRGWQMRLCPDCVAIRIAHMDERFGLPMPLPASSTPGGPCPACGGPTIWQVFDFVCHPCRLTVLDAIAQLDFDANVALAEKLMRERRDG